MRPALLAAAFGLAAMHGAARADVFEIAADGTMTVRANAGGQVKVVGSDGAADAEIAPDVPVAALTTIAPAVAPASFQAPLVQAAAQAEVSPALLAALVWQESRWHPAALSPKGARGLTQLMPGTARALAVDPANVAANLAGGARYLRNMLDMFDGNVESALAAYNAGPGRVMRGAGLPAIAETRAYVSSIIDRVGAARPDLAGVMP